MFLISGNNSAMFWCLFRRSAKTCFRAALLQHSIGAQKHANGFSQRCFVHNNANVFNTCETLCLLYSNLDRNHSTTFAGRATRQVPSSQRQSRILAQTARASKMVTASCKQRSTSGASSSNSKRLEGGYCRPKMTKRGMFSSQQADPQQLRTSRRAAFGTLWLSSISSTTPPAPPLSFRQSMKSVAPTRATGRMHKSSPSSGSSSLSSAPCPTFAPRPVTLPLPRISCSQMRRVTAWKLWKSLGPTDATQDVGNSPRTRFSACRIVAS
mmetsp:Transcript_12838/g.35466  ORF Transcript_12838/g.35466 Transcript_12838/m.35466 type:complete len:268 (-) Transcript_12838:2-805(-)